jgi:superfamily II DNA/RNA helicase
VKGPLMLIVAPTRELAMQSQEVLEEAGKSCNIRREDRDYIKRTYVFFVLNHYRMYRYFCE